MDATDRPILDQVNLVVGDMTRSVEFYRLLGVHFPDDEGPWGAHHRSGRAGTGLDFDLDSTQFAPKWCEGWPAGAPGVVVGFRLPSRDAVDETYARLTAAGHRGKQPPWDAFWGSRYAIIEDPDGNAIGLMSPRDPSMASPVDPPSD